MCRTALRLVEILALLLITCRFRSGAGEEDEDSVGESDAESSGEAHVDTAR